MTGGGVCIGSCATCGVGSSLEGTSCVCLDTYPLQALKTRSAAAATGREKNFIMVIDRKDSTKYYCIISIISCIMSFAICAASANILRFDWK